MKGEHVDPSAKRRDVVIDLAAVVILVFGLNLLIWGDLAARGVGALIYRRYATRRGAR
jgi:hypothetical protein